MEMDIREIGRGSITAIIRLKIETRNTEINLQLP
jgi:hypothetical protein